MYDWDKLIFTVAVAGLAFYAVHTGDKITVGVCLGIMGAILRPGTQQKDDSTSTTTIIKKSLPPADVPSVQALTDPPKEVSSPKTLPE